MYSKIADPKAQEGLEREVAARVRHQERRVSSSKRRTLTRAGHRYRLNRVGTEVMSRKHNPRLLARHSVQQHRAKEIARHHVVDHLTDRNAARRVVVPRVHGDGDDHLLERERGGYQ